MRIAPPNKNKHNLTIDTSVFVLCLSEDAHFLEQFPKAPMRPSIVRGILQEIVGTLPPTWILHQEEVRELREVVEGVILRSLEVMNGQSRPKPDQVYLNAQEVQNAQEFLTYINALENELISNPDRKDVVFGSAGCWEAEHSLALANCIRDEVRAMVGHDEFRDTLFCCFALANSNPFTGTDNVIHCDKHFDRIRDILNGHISMLTRHDPKHYEELPEPQKVLCREFACANPDKRKKTPIIRLPSFVDLRAFQLRPKPPDRPLAGIMGGTFPVPGLE